MSIENRLQNVVSQMSMTLTHADKILIMQEGAVIDHRSGPVVLIRFPSSEDGITSCKIARRFYKAIKEFANVVDDNTPQHVQINGHADSWEWMEDK